MGYVGMRIGRLIAFAALLTGAGAHAAGNAVPNTFSSNTPISATQMNSNFSAVTGQMPAVKSTSATWVEIPSTASQLQLITVTPPVNGFVIVQATGSMSLVDSTSPFGNWCLDLNTVTGDTGGCSPMAGSKSAARGWLSAATSGSGEGLPYAITEVFSVTGGTARTFYLNGYAQNFNASGAWLFHPTITVLFVPGTALP